MTRLFLSSFLLSFILLSKPVRSQFVKETFSEPLYIDNFSSDAGNWKIQSNADNLFVIQDGEYLLKRKNTSTGYSVFTNWKTTTPSFEIDVRLSLEKSADKESSAGIIFMAQEDGSGAFVFEINNAQQYRLKQLVGVNYRLLTGENKSNGWVNSAFLSLPNEPNLIQIRCSERNYDLYINQHYLISFTELAYKSGKTGINIGPASSVRVDSFSIFGLKDNSEKIQSENTPCEEVQIRLKEELTDVRKENEALKDSVRLLNKKLMQLNEKNKTLKTKHLE